jgi:DNA repair photolyase
MDYKHIHVQSLLKKITFTDKLFGGEYTLDPYQNCEFGCSYCDSSYEKTVFIKTNAVELLKKELQDIVKGRIIIGSVHDPYQPIEERTQLTREILQIINEYNLPVHILTKSPFILRDLDILRSLKDVLVTFTIITTDEHISNIFEKNVPSPEKRFQTIRELKNNNINVGMALIPILPYITEKNVEDLIEKAYNSQVDHIIYKHLELKGDQKDIMLSLLNEVDSNLIKKYEKLYHNRYYPLKEYLDIANNKIESVCKRYSIPTFST